MKRKRSRLVVPDAKLKAPPPGSIGIRAYARARTKAGHPITHAGIAKAISSGRIAAAVWRDEKTRPWIDPKHADELLDQNTDPAAQRENRKGGRPLEEKSEGLFAPGGPQAEVVKPEIDDADKPSATFNRHRAEREGLDVKLARLKLSRETGELVSAAVVRVRCENVGILVRDAIRNVPPRIAGQLAACQSAHEAEEILTDELDRALQGLAELGRAVG